MIVCRLFLWFIYQWTFSQVTNFSGRMLILNILIIYQRHLSGSLHLCTHYKVKIYFVEKRSWKVLEVVCPLRTTILIGATILECGERKFFYGQNCTSNIITKLLNNCFGGVCKENEVLYSTKIIPASLPLFFLLTLRPLIGFLSFCHALVWALESYTKSTENIDEFIKISFLCTKLEAF